MDDLEDYQETNLDEIVRLQRTFSLERSPRMIQHSRSTGSAHKKSCCSAFRKKKKKKKKRLSFTRQLFAPLVTLKDLISTSFSVSSSSSSSTAVAVPPQETKVFVPSTPQSSCKSISLLFDPPLSISTPKCSLVHSYTSLSNYRLKSSLIQRQYSLEEEIHQDECLYCSSESALKLSHLSLFHAVELYLSANNSLNELSSISNVSSEQQATSSETKPLNLCEINEIIYAIQSSSETDEERRETLDALALSLREVAEETPLAPADEAPAAELGQIVARAVLYEIVIRLFSFYLFFLMCYGH